MVSRTAARLAYAFLAYLIGVTLLVTLVPFDFIRSADASVTWWATPSDFIANIAMFVPLGFLYRLTRPGKRDRLALRALGAGILLSAAIEVAQLYLPSRFSSPADIIANGTGAWLGALAHDRIASRLRLTPSLVGSLALELPLMGLVYLLIPLLWLSGLVAADDPSRLLLSLVLGLIGSIVLGSIHRHRFGPTGAISRARFGVMASIWFLAGALPGLAMQPVWVGFAAIAVGLSTMLWSMERLPESGPDRRFEAETLRRLAPFFGLYLVFLSGWPPWAEWVALHSSVSPARLWGAADTFAIMRVLEQLASFTVLGYLLAEGRGRLEQPYRATLPVLLVVGSAVALFAEFIAGMHPGAGMSPLRGLLAVAITCYGGGLYHLQRSHIRWLLRYESDIPMLHVEGVPGIEPAGMGRLPTNTLVQEKAGAKVQGPKFPHTG